MNLKQKLIAIARDLDLSSLKAAPPSAQQLVTAQWENLFIMSVTVVSKRKLWIADDQDGKIRVLYSEGTWRPNLTPTQIATLEHILESHYSSIVFQGLEDNLTDADLPFSLVRIGEDV